VQHHKINQTARCLNLTICATVSSTSISQITRSDSAKSAWAEAAGQLLGWAGTQARLLDWTGTQAQLPQNQHVLGGRRLIGSWEPHGEGMRHQSSPSGSARSQPSTVPFPLPPPLLLGSTPWSPRVQIVPSPSLTAAAGLVALVAPREQALQAGVEEGEELLAHDLAPQSLRLGLLRDPAALRGRTEEGRGRGEGQGEGVRVRGKR
jgi:hypothetical protein